MTITLSTPLAQTITARPCRRSDETLSDSAWQGPYDQLIASLPTLADHLRRQPDLSLLAIIEGSPYLRNLILNNGPRLIHLLQDLSREQFDRHLQSWRLALASQESEAGLMATIREAKQEVALFLALADLAAQWPVMAITQALTQFADEVLCATVDFLLHDLARRGLYSPGNPDHPRVSSGLIILAMGKMGAFELNYSSDIDLIIFFDPAKPRLKTPDEATALFVRLTRSLVKILQERTPEGYGFRVDLRLRPDPGSTGVAMAVGAALTYYEGFGQQWERAALIKARPVACDDVAAEAFLKEIAPFIWRRYIDASLLLEVRRLKQRMESYKGIEDRPLVGRDLKLGFGGIREIEFLVQTRQLMLGGRHPELRVRATLEALDYLAASHHITVEEAEGLSQSYCFLRDLEHRVQMLKDEQTHSLPQAQDIEAFARFCGFEDAQELAQHLDRITRRVTKAYKDFFFKFDDEALAGLPDRKPLPEHLSFAQSPVAEEILTSWQSRRYPALASDTAHKALNQMLPHLLGLLDELGYGEAGLIAFDRFLASLPVGVQLFSLFHARPALLTLLLRILTTAPRLADVIRHHPHVFDVLLDLGNMRQDQEAADYKRLQHALKRAERDEEQLDLIRLYVKERQFLLGTNLLSGLASVDQIAEGFTRTAENAICLSLDLAEVWMKTRHGTFDGQAVTVLALGRLGSADMTAHSDLDLIVIYDVAPDSTESDGARPLMASTYFTKLTQRMVMLLSAPTAEGIAYELDFRLRPSGNAGPLAVTFDSFYRYQREDAWTWEHMALTRARPVAGDPALKTRVQEALRDILNINRDPETVYAEIRSMRQLIEQEKPPKNDLDLKLSQGGLIDIEFIVQAFILTSSISWQEPSARQGENVMMCARQAGLLTGDEADGLLVAWRQQKQLNQILRLLVKDQFDEKEASSDMKVFIADLMGCRHFDALTESLRDNQAWVRGVFDYILGLPKSDPASSG